MYKNIITNPPGDRSVHIITTTCAVITRPSQSSTKFAYKRMFTKPPGDRSVQQDFTRHTTNLLWSTVLSFFLECVTLLFYPIQCFDP